MHILQYTRASSSASRVSAERRRHRRRQQRPSRAPADGAPRDRAPQVVGAERAGRRNRGCDDAADVAHVAFPLPDPRPTRGGPPPEGPHRHDELQRGAAGEDRKVGGEQAPQDAQVGHYRPTNWQAAATMTGRPPTTRDPCTITCNIRFGATPVISQDHHQCNKIESKLT